MPKVPENPYLDNEGLGDLEFTRNPSTGKSEKGDLSNLRNPSTGKNEIADLSNLRNPSTGKNEIADLSHLRNPSTGKNGIADLSHLRFPAAGKYDIKTPSNAASDYQDWPLAKFAFTVSVGGFDGEVAFQGVDGLGASVGKMEFRDGNSNKFYKQNRPTLASFDPCTLKKGMFVGDMRLYSWFNNVSTGQLFSDTRTVTITLGEHQGGSVTPIFVWTLEKAYVTKFTPSSMDGEADAEAAIEEVEITYQSFTMSI
jgi:phage tail-like protein